MADFTPPFVDKFRSNPIGNPPDPKGTDKVADETWFVRKAQWLYSLWLTDYAYVPFSNANEYTNLRRYAHGRQSTLKYMNVLDPKDTTTGERSGFYNISWDIVPIYPKYRDRIRGALSRFDFSTSVQSLDDNSEDDRRFMAFQSYVKQQHKAWEESMDAAMGVETTEQIEDQSMYVKPRSLQEMEMFESMGAYRLPLEASMEKLIFKSAKLSEWEEIKLRLEEDFIDLGIAVVQDYTDPISKIPMVRYVDPAFWICAATRDNAYTEIADCAEVRFLTLAQCKDYGMNDEQIHEAANLYQGLYMNPSWNTVYRNGQWDWQQMSLFRIAILDMDFSSWNTEHYESRTNADGQDIFFRINEKNVGKDKKKKYSERNYERRYQGKWVIGSKIMLPGFGYQYNQVFDSDNRPKCSYSAYRVSDRSITSRCISTLDDLQLCVLKFRNAWARAKPAGIMVEWGSLTGMSMGGKKLQPTDILKIYSSSGDLLYRATSEGGRPIQGINAPITELAGGIGQMLNEFITTFNTHISTLGDLTAIGRGQDGSLPGGDTLVGVANIAEAATQDTLRPIVMGYKRLKARSSNNICLRWQLRLADEDVSEYVQNKEGVSGEIVRLSYDDVRGRRIQVNCDMIIDDTQKQMAINAALESIKAAKTGSIGITYADFLVVMQAVERGQVKWAFMWIHYREEQEKQYQLQKEQMMMQQNQQGALSLEQAKQQATMAELEAKIQVEQISGAIEIQKIKVKGEEDRKTLNVKVALETGSVKPVMPSSLPDTSLPSSPRLSQQPEPSSPGIPQPAAPESPVAPVQEPAIPMMS